MSTTFPSRLGLDNAAFLSKISPNIKRYPSLSKSDDVVKQASEQNASNKIMTDGTNTKVTVASVDVTENAATETIASPENNPSSTVPSEKEKAGTHLNAPPDQSKPNSPLIASVQAQGSPQVSGVQAPPPTPETVSNLAIGQLFMNVLDDFPPERMLTLGDSIHAPKNYSKFRYNRSTAASQSQSQFFSPVPQSSKPRQDASFTRMSFKAAETPSPPMFSLPTSENEPVKVESQQTTTTLKSVSHLGQSVDTSQDIKVPQLKVSDLNETTATPAIQGLTANIRDAPPPPPRLEPSAAKDFQAAKVSTPDVPDRPLDTKSGAVSETPIQPREARIKPMVPITAVDSLKSTKEAEKAKEVEEAAKLAVPESPAGGHINVAEVSTPRASPAPAGGLLTPKSMTSNTLSPQGVKGAGTTPASKPAKSGGEDLKEALFFTAWPTQPKVEGRGTRTAAKVRKVMLTGIPSGATPSLVASYVFGGPLERIHVGDSSAFVTFLRGEDAEKFYLTTENGLDYEKDGEKRVIMTEMTSEVNPVSGILREYIEKEFTRCVRAIGVDKEWTMMALHEVAARKGRKVEKIVDGLNPSKMRSVNFRFCDISDAVKFKQSLGRDEDWEECNVHFAPDPCASATDIHFD